MYRRTVVNETNVCYNKIGEIMKISHIKKMSGAKYKIILMNGEELVAYEDSILKYNLLYKKEIDAELQLLIQKENLYYEVYHKVVKYIMTKLRSKKEIDVCLEKYPLEEKEKENILEKLKQIGLINDEKYAKAFAMDKLHLGNYGPNKIRSELEQNQIDSVIIEDVMASIDETVVLEKLKKLLSKKIKQNRKYSEYYLKQKMVTEFVNLGFSREQIISLFDELFQKNDAVIEQEYRKLKMKLEKKYQKEQLNYQIRQKLYQKGFMKEEIEEVIEKSNG